jgi:hypothetical protein
VPDNLSYFEDVTMELSTAQMRALENGEVVSVTINHTRCIILRTDVYERVQALLDMEAAYPLIDETSREGWEYAFRLSKHNACDHAF